MENGESKVTDLTVTNHGSILLLSGNTEAGHAWLDAHIPEDHQTWCNDIVIEPRYIEDIINGAAQDGLIISLGG